MGEAITETNKVFSKRVRAGRRTYYFDIKSTKTNDYYVTITERKQKDEATSEKYKIFLYKEDLNKFLKALTETVDYIKEDLLPDYDFSLFDRGEIENEDN